MYSYTISTHRRPDQLTRCHWFARFMPVRERPLRVLPASCPTSAANSARGVRKPSAVPQFASPAGFAPVGLADSNERDTWHRWASLFQTGSAVIASWRSPEARCTPGKARRGIRADGDNNFGPSRQRFSIPARVEGLRNRDSSPCLQLQHLCFVKHSVSPSQLARRSRMRI
jgi:hypothetical protein